jgi:phage protein D
MVLDLLDPQTLGRLVGVICLMVMAAAAGYAKGFKEGKREGMHVAKQSDVTLQMSSRRSLHCQ